MDKESVITIAQRFSDLVARQLPVKLIVLYGSYAKENAGPDSDIDIAVIVERLEEDFLDTSARLFKLRRTVDFRIEPLLIKEGEDESGFLEDILEKGRILYSSNM